MASGTTNEELKLCLKNKRKCSKFNGHTGACNSKRSVNPFYKSSPIIKRKKQEKESNELATLINSEKETLTIYDKVNTLLIVLIEGIETATIEKTSLEESKASLEEDVKKLNSGYNELKLAIEQKKHSKTQREKNPTSEETSRTTRHNRCIESKHMLEYIHGGIDGAIFGAWEFLTKYAQSDFFEKALHEYKKGKFMQKLYGNFNESTNTESMNEAVASKFQLSLSRRKFTYLYKVKSKIYDPETEKWSNKSISYGDKKINLNNMSLSDHKVMNFVNEMDIGILPCPKTMG